MLFKSNLRIVISIVFIISAKNICAHNLNQDLEKLTHSIQRKYSFSSVTLSLSIPNQNKELNFFSGSKSLSDKEKSNKKSLYKIGSITKTYTAALIYNLIQQNKLSLNDKISTILPEYSLWKNVRIKNLLDNTSGIEDYINSKNWWDNFFDNPSKVWQKEELIQIAYQEPLLFHPGEKWGYANTNYVLLGSIIEKVNNEKNEASFTQLFSENNLKNSYFIPSIKDPLIVKNAVHGYDGQKDLSELNSSWGQTVRRNVRQSYR